MGRMTDGLNASATTGLMVTVPPGPLPGSGGTSFSVDPDKAQDCIRWLREAALDLVDARRILARAYVDPPARDLVSLNFAKQAATMADRAGAFVTAWQNQLIGTADALQQQLDDYRAVDENNRVRLT